MTELSKIARCWLLWCVAVFLICSSAMAQAQTAASRAGQLFKGLKSFHAAFRQQVVDVDGHVVQQSSGQVAIRRPGRFRWDYQLPYRQLIVADGKQLWIYDEDLEQVTVSMLDNSLEQTPALLLSRDISLEENFDIRALPDSKGLQWLAMIPKDPSATYSEIRLGVSDGSLHAMQLVDGFGQVTHLDFTDIRVNETLPESLFRFKPPPNTDIIYGQDVTTTTQ